jgi:hypothetical protein
VDATGEQHMAVGDVVGAKCRDQLANQCLPQYKARPRADVPATLAALEDESPNSVARKQLQQSGRWNM